MDRRIDGTIVLLLLLVTVIMLGSCASANSSRRSRKLLSQEDKEQTGGGGGGVSQEEEEGKGGGGLSQEEGEQGGGKGKGGEGEGEEGIPSESPRPKTITFFMHDIVGGVNPTAKPLSAVGGFPLPTGPQGISGLQSPFAFGIGNTISNINGNGPLPLTLPAGALPVSGVNGVGVGQLQGFPSTGLVPNGVAGIGSGSGLGLGVGGLVPGSAFGNGQFFPSTFPNSFNGQLQPQPQNPLLGGASGVPFPLNANADAKDVMVIEDPLTEGPDLHSALLGKAHGYYMRMHMPEEEEEEDDADTLLLTFTAIFVEGEESEFGGSSIEFSGKDNIAMPHREISVVGGTGVFHDAQGHALIETVSDTADHTVLKFTVTFTY